MTHDEQSRSVTAATSTPLIDRDLPPLLAGYRSMLDRRSFSPFHRLILLIAAANIVFGVVFLLRQPPWNLWLGGLLTAASVNVGLAAVMRQQYFVNALFSVTRSAPLRWPLRVRAALAQVHHVPGGVHVGAAMSATVWFFAYAVSVVITPPPSAGTAQHAAILVTVIGIALDLLVMSFCARPSMRHHHHDLFEATHRYGGWLSIVLFTTLTLLHAAADRGPAGTDILQSPTPGSSQRCSSSPPSRGCSCAGYQSPSPSRPTTSHWSPSSTAGSGSDRPARSPATPSANGTPSPT